MKNQDNKYHILFCSRLVHEKGASVLVDVLWNTLKDPFFQKKIVWHITSEGEYQAEIEKLSQKFSQNVIYYGQIPQRDLADLMRKVDYLFMPSRFLETFGLTALESLACGTPVIGIRKGGLLDFIPENLSLDEDDLFGSIISILTKILNGEIFRHSFATEFYRRNNWKIRFEKIFPPQSRIFILHDFAHKIGGAEAYVDDLAEYLPKIGYNIKRVSYPGQTSPFLRRVLFIGSIFAFWRFFLVFIALKKAQPHIIWMHSVLRYYGFWGILAVSMVARKNKIPLYLSHHDLGFIAPFPQDIYSEKHIPKNLSGRNFLEHTSSWKKEVARIKWIYIKVIRCIFPQNLQHIVFSPFLEGHIKNHFPDNQVIVLPHTFNEDIFHI